MIKAVLIDIDDTIFDFEKCSKNSFLKTLEKFNLKFKEEDFSYFNKVNDILWTKQKLGEINIKEVFIKRDYPVSYTHLSSSSNLAKLSMCFFGITRKWIGACGSRSLNAITF